MSYKYQYNRILVSFAKSNRKDENPAEDRLWYYIRNRRLQGYKFRREYPIHNYILDFYCVEKKLAIELDGSQHQENKIYDQKRDNELKKLRIKVLRFWDEDIFWNIFHVLDQILFVLDSSVKQPHPNPLLKGEGKLV